MIPALTNLARLAEISALSTGMMTNVSDGYYLNFGTPLQTLQQAIGGAVTVNPGGPWGSSNYYYAFPGTSGYHPVLFTTPSVLT